MMEMEDESESELDKTKEHLLATPGGPGEDPKSADLEEMSVAPASSKFIISFFL